jgi:microcystin-dependent protein
MEGYLAEIRMFGGNFAPRGWFFCQGQLLSIAQWTAVFALVGTTYGGNGQTTFGVPDLRGRSPLGTGQGPGQPNIDLGEMAGTTSQTLLITNLPMHNHTLTGAITPQAAGDGALGTDATGRRVGPGSFYSGSTDELVNMAPLANNLQVGINGSNQPVATVPPYLGMNFIMCVEGIFPSRN